MTGTVVVTGGSGFIGSAFIRTQLSDRRVVNIDVGSYAADERRLEGIPIDIETIDVADERLSDVLSRISPSIVFHFAAETHVTRSETNPEIFFRTNAEGTRNVLAA